jgi:hypothetical protein
MFRRVRGEALLAGIVAGLAAPLSIITQSTVIPPQRQSPTARAWRNVGDHMWRALDRNMPNAETKRDFSRYDQ